MSSSSGMKGKCNLRQEDKSRVEQEERRRLMERIGELSQRLEKFNLAEYMNMLNNPRRYLMVNFLGGLFRGFGIALGMTLLGAVILWFLQRLVRLNLPIIGDFIADLVRIVLTFL